MKKARARAEAAAASAQETAPVLPGPESATARLSITRGCPCLCSFCFEGHDRKPFREIPAAEVLRAARELKIATGASTLEVESFNFNMHTGLAVILDGLSRMYHRVNLMSQRVDVLARTPWLLDLEIAADKHSFTFGIEGISGRQRAFLHKSLAEDDIRRVVEEVHARKSREMKLFYMLTGRETEADFGEFAEFVKWMRQVRQKSNAAPRVVFSFGYLVRMPFTPLRHDPPVLQERAWQGISGRVKSVCETNGFEFRLSSSWPEYAATQALASGGHALFSLLEKMSEAGCVTDAGLADQARQAVERWIHANGETISAEKPLDSPFPFGFLDDERSRRFLYGQYERAKHGRDGGYARKLSGRDAAQDGGLIGQARALDELMHKKRRLRPVYVQALLPREAAGMGAPWIDAWLLRQFLAGHPDGGGQRPLGQRDFRGRDGNGRGRSPMVRKDRRCRHRLGHIATRLRPGRCRRASRPDPEGFRPRGRADDFGQGGAARRILRRPGAAAGGVPAGRARTGHRVPLRGHDAHSLPRRSP